MKNFNAIVFFRPETKLKVRKYRNISNLPQFIIFAQKMDDWYCNLYHAKTKIFYKRVYLD